ncbi:pilus assembly protein [Bradyrhizobium jicamae]|uniref:Pilus assembly protein n=1 Tax=Bradyrhizobium jicamae TaxID=280332 RepID=A0ABS5FTH6_9BRAD|nr:TadE/TadG family type IV pilus assembly protein [Bradyrhizobium jicamae]MBR0800149.1 pilus assembly protein [Bradyrhizobium jicamae]MBR0936382.1 pilus assembly protein [Bradyrhizobium jicamae]
MLGKALFGRLGSAARRFAAARDGNIAVLFTLAAIPVVTFVGAAVDYSRANAARSSMQSALDSTVLMVSKDLTAGTITTAQIATQAQNYFNALYTNKDAQGITVTSSYTTATSSAAATILLSGSGHIKTDFMQLAGFPTMNFATTSTSTWGNVKMRVALALDNTGSMAQSGKITALRNAVAGSGGLIDQLSALSKTNGDVYISVIPFAKVVNVGNSNYSQSWIDWTDWLNPPTTQPNNGSTQASLPMNWHAVGPGAQCPWTNTSGGFTCLSSPTSTSSVSTIPSSGSYKGYICPSVDYNSHSAYNGCWVSTAAGTGVFCSGSSSCACPTNSSGAAVSGCSCSGSGSGKSCTGNLYTHDWTQPGANDTTHNTYQPRVSAVVGWTNNKWTSTNSTPTVQNNWTQASTDPITNWTGCITDRTQPNDATGVLPASSDVTTLFPANEYYENSTAYCSSSASTPLEPIIPLSYNWSTLKTAVNAMQPTGGTDQSVGLAWAWQSLIVGGPLNTPAEDANTTYNRVIILLSDGLNTEDRWPDYGNGNTQASGNPIDARQTTQCQNIKNATDSKGQPMYTIYTIQVNTDGDPTSTVLQNCASSPDKFFMLTSSSQIVTTFNTIGTALSKLRLAK